MYKITIKGEAKTNHKNLEELSGIDCQDEFSEYFSREYKNDANEQCLIDKNVCNGYMRFEYNDGKLWTITTYDSPILLTQEELDILSNYTQGQWSDGIGEGFEQEDCFYDDNDKGVCISPWFGGQVLIKEQIEVAEPFDWARIEKKQQQKVELAERMRGSSERVNKLLKEADELIERLSKKK